MNFVRAFVNYSDITTCTELGIPVEATAWKESVDGVLPAEGLEVVQQAGHQAPRRRGPLVQQPDTQVSWMTIPFKKDSRYGITIMH